MRVLLRTDASVALGTTHVMRCLALAQALRTSGDESVLAGSEMPEVFREHLSKEDFEFLSIASHKGTVEDALETRMLGKQHRVSAVILDGRHFTPAYQQNLKSEDTCLCVVNDDGLDAGCRADILVNPNLDASERLYSEAEIEKKLIGKRYALLTQEFWDTEVKRTSLRTRRVLVAMGGADPDNVTGKVVRALKKSTVEHLEIRAIVGPANPYGETLRHQASRPGHPVDVISPAWDLRVQCEWADVAVAEAGHTALELARAGTAAIYLTLEESQESTARSIRKHGFGKALGWHEDVTEDQIRSAVRDLLRSSDERDRMSEWGRDLIDGQGALRVAKAIREFCL